MLLREKRKKKKWEGREETREDEFHKQKLNFKCGKSEQTIIYPSFEENTERAGGV